LRLHAIATRLRAWLDDDPRAGQSEMADVELLAEKLDLGVERFAAATQPAGTLGYLEPGEDLIFVRAGLPSAMRRFTLAHEIGHAVLHRATGAAIGHIRMLLGDDFVLAETSAPRCGKSDLEAPLDPLGLEDEQLSPGQAYSARSRREMEANAFAAALLLPAAALLRAYGQPSASAPRTARALARRLGVSEDVVLRRLAALLLGAETVAAPDTLRSEVGARTLDPTQRAAAAIAAPALVIAGPGTGKTSTLVGRVAYLVRECGITPEAILALTFSNKAAREMRERVALLLETAPSDEGAMRGLPAISTIHAFCGELLRQFGPRVGLRPDFRLVTEAEGYFLLRTVCAQLPIKHYQPIAAPAQYIPDLLGAISRAKDELAGPEDYTRAAEAMRLDARTADDRVAAERAREVALIYDTYQRTLAERGDPDFGDVVRLAVQLLREHSDVREQVRARFAHILVDEFQDVNRAMGLLLRELAGPEGPLWAVGDADQAIYRFRGASPANLARFVDDYPGGRVCRLERNYRSVAPILEAAAAFASAALEGGEREPLVATRTPAEEPSLAFAGAPDAAAELAGLVGAVRQHLEDGRVPDDLAVLCRTRRFAQQVAASLRAAGVPVRMPAPVLEQEETKDLLAIPALLADPSGAGWLRAGKLAAHRFSREDARALLRAARAAASSPVQVLKEGGAPHVGVSLEGARGQKRLARVLSELRAAPDVATGLGRYLFSLTPLGRDLLLAGADGSSVAHERALQIARLLALARAYDDQRRGSAPAGPRTADWPGFLEYLRVLVLLRQGDAGGEGAPEGGAPGVAVLTIHASKGLEFPVVFLPGLADRRFPVRGRWEAAPLPPALRQDAAPIDVAAGQLIEEACLFYVALTRARDGLVLSVAERYGKLKSAPSPFLAPIHVRMGARLACTQWLAAAAPPQALALETSDPQRDGRTPIQVGEIETYLRCPRQYAYRYVYGLHGPEPGIAALRRGVRASIHELHAFAVGTDSSQGSNAPTGQPSPLLPSLDDTLASFEFHWQEATGGAPRDELADQALRRHGRGLVEREWRALMAAHSTDQGIPGALPDVDLDATVEVRTVGRDIRLALDRVERPSAAPPSMASSHGPMAHQVGEPVRFVRQHLGGSPNRADVRALLYRLAAEQYGTNGGAAEAVQQSSNGYEERIVLSRRQEERVREELAGALAGMEEGNYPARPDPHTCAGCPFLMICPE
jgi:superfamily I DNA/RNA helicase/Zn-dependent peptidase ImmA (M78 family)